MSGIDEQPKKDERLEIEKEYERKIAEKLIDELKYVMKCIK